ncbi:MULTISPECIES: hypothetical protein [Flavobacterium]|uniref:Terminase n=1 Tax=Flavobacterium keumense TaxID=1306518 RepID=A0ABY8N2A5_9FLAO|nr:MULTISPECIES: hypothetical protein [Flavobacterium]WGK93797.1 hypothetical protein MG292_06750 [Flavobacterium keumense]
MRNKTNQWKYGYNEQIDTVIISRDGTLGRIYNVCGLNIGFPEQPDHKQILNWDKTTINQKWKREEIPNDLGEHNWHYAKFENYIDECHKRRYEGVWVYIKGIPVYIPGTYYYGLQWIREEHQYPKFRIIQNELMIFWEACKADDRCYGMQYVKNRRFGATMLGIFELLESGTITSNKLLGIVSKKGKDAKKIFNRLVRAFKRMPPFFIPETDGNTTPKTELIFAKPSRKRKKGETLKEEEALETEIVWHNTEINAMDGDKIFRSILDESAKYPKEVPFDDYWYIVKTSHRVGRRITGKSFVISTVNDLDKGGREYKTVWDQSDISKRNDNGQTKSGLYRIFIPAKYGLEGFYDEYGFSIVDEPTEPVKSDIGDTIKQGSASYLKAELDALKDDPAKYNEQLRQFPDTERDAFRESADECAFDLMKLLEQIDHNEFELEDSEYGNNLVERGNFEWKDGIQDTEVIWRPNLEKGRFWIRKDAHPPLEYRNQKEMKMIRGVLAWAPKNEHIGCGGVDPYNRSKTVDNRGSQGSIHFSTKYNTGPFPNNAFILEYIDRPSKVELFYEDVIMAMVYLSMPILPELSSEKFSQYLIDRKYRHFVKNNPFKKWDDMSDSEKTFGGVPPQDAKIGDQQYYAVEAYIADHVGVARDTSNRPIGQMGEMYFNRTLIQWKEVDPQKRTKYDAYISSSLSILGNQNRIIQEVEKPKPMRVPFKKYDNKGSISKAV